MKVDVAIIGAGITGLTAGVYLKRAGKNVLLIESSDRVGGRIKTDRFDGFVLDHGFQVILSEYPELKSMLNLEKLKLKKFLPGAYVLKDQGVFKQISDPSRLTKKIFKSLFSGVGTLSDKIKILSLRNKLRHLSIDQIFAQPEITTAEAFKQYGFSNSFIEQFLKPFYAGVFLDAELNTSRRMFDFCFKMFCEGYAALPEDGMEQIPLQLKAEFNADEIHFNSTVTKIDGHKVTTDKGITYHANKIIMACDPGDSIDGFASNFEVKYQSCSTFYYKYSHSPLLEPFLALGGIPGKLINHLAVITDVADKYSYTSDALISVSVVNDRGLNDDILAREVKKELKEWFGPEASYWELIKFYPIKKALPVQHSVTNVLDIEKATVKNGLYQVGDFSLNSSINGAMSAGRQLAEYLANTK